MDISKELSKYETKFKKEYKLTRDDLKEFLREHFNLLNVSELCTIEGIHHCRGASMEKSSRYDRGKLVEWLKFQIPIL